MMGRPVAEFSGKAQDDISTLFKKKCDTTGFLFKNQLIFQNGKQS
jgi:hypothetical protein